MTARRIGWVAISFFLRAYWRMTRPFTAGARAIVLDEEDRILLVRHTYVPGWYLPGGGVDKNETMRTAMVRELEEEVGVLVEGEAPLLGIYANFRQHKNDHVALYLVRRFRMEPRPSKEIAEFGFFARSALPEETTRATQQRIDEFFEQRSPAEYW